MLDEWKGIEDDVSFGQKKRQVAVIEKEVFDRIREALPEVEPAMPRSMPKTGAAGVRRRARRRRDPGRGRRYPRGALADVVPAAISTQPTPATRL